MRKKELKLIVTFHTTAAGCGLSWCADLKEREKVQEIMKRVGIEEEEIHECMV